MPEGVDVTLPLSPWRPISKNPLSRIITKTSALPDSRPAKPVNAEPWQVSWEGSLLETGEMKSKELWWLSTDRNASSSGIPEQLQTVFLFFWPKSILQTPYSLDHHGRSLLHSPYVHLQLHDSQVFSQLPELLLSGLQTPGKIWQELTGL